MRVFVDTSVWARFYDVDDPLGVIARERVLGLRGCGAEVIISTQIVRELWCVLTRGGPGLDVPAGQAQTFAQTVGALSSLLLDGTDQHLHWLRLISEYSVRGSLVHDANHVAFMLSHGISRVLTHNERDFARYTREGITVLGLEESTI